MSLSSLVSATESAVRLSEAAVAAAEEATSAARLASIHATSALAATRLALDLERKRESLLSLSAHSSLDHNLPAMNQEEYNHQEELTSSECRSSTPEEEYSEACGARPNKLDIEKAEKSEDDEHERRMMEVENNENERKFCPNCKRFIWNCRDSKFVREVTTKTIGVKVKKGSYGKVGRVVGGDAIGIAIRWNKNDNPVSYDLVQNNRHIFRFFCENEHEPSQIDDDDDDDESVESNVGEYDDKKLFVGSLDYSVTHDNLKEYFERFGRVTDWVVMKNQYNKFAKGYGFVTFQKSEMAQQCLDIQPHILKGKVLDLKRAAPRVKHQHPSKLNTRSSGESSFEKNKLFITGLDSTVTNEDLKEYFGKFGKLSDWVVMMTYNHQSKCYGFVTFESPRSMEICMNSKFPHYLKGKLFNVKQSRRYTSKDSSQEDRNFNFPQNWLFAHRLLNKDGGEVWQHTHNYGGEKHRMRFCTSENITMTGIGLLVHSTIARISFNICQKVRGDHDHDHNVIFQQIFDNVNASSVCSILLKMKYGVQLSCDNIYLLVLTVHGGASYVGYGGEEFVEVKVGGGEQGEDSKDDVLFKFEEYKHQSAQFFHETTDVEKGLVEKIYFEM